MELAVRIITYHNTITETAAAVLNSPSLQYFTVEDNDSTSLKVFKLAISALSLYIGVILLSTLFDLGKYIWSLTCGNRDGLVRTPPSFPEHQDLAPVSSISEQSSSGNGLSTSESSSPVNQGVDNEEIEQTRYSITITAPEGSSSPSRASIPTPSSAESDSGVDAPVATSASSTSQIPSPQLIASSSEARPTSPISPISVNHLPSYDELPCTSRHIQLVQEIILPLRENLALLTKQEELRNKGNELQRTNLHTFKFLEIIFKNRDLTIVIKSIVNSKYNIINNRKKTEFINGISQRVRYYQSIGQFDCYIEGFEKKMGLEENSIRRFISQQNYEGLILYLCEKTSSQPR